MKTKSIVLAVSLALLLTAPALAGVPDEISFMGRLIQSGQPVTSTTTITFQLYENATGGSPVWSEVQGVTPNGQGVYVAYLGTALNPIPTSYDTLYLQVIVEGTMLTPRRKFTSVPYARRADTADDVGTLPDLDVSGDATVGGAIDGFGIMPIGSIIAWHKNLGGVPALPDGWVECNGQTLSDPDSLLNGQAIPNLNGGGRFLRGSSTSGTEQNATTVNNYPGYLTGSSRIYLGVSNADGYTPVGETIVQNGLGYTSVTVEARKVRPINMSVIWIMRTK